MKSYRDYTKYKNHKVETDEGTFDSKKEYKRWQELKILERGGKITKLQRQVPYLLVPTQRTETVTERAVKYIADFVYERDGKIIVEDTKGFKTPEYIIKRKLMLFFYGIEVREIV